MSHIRKADEVVLPSGRFVDWALLNPKATLTEHKKLCLQAIRHPHMRGVCILPDPEKIKLCLDLTANTDVAVVTVIDYPFGNGGKLFKMDQVATVYGHGVREVDVVPNLPMLVHEYNLAGVADEMCAIVNAASDLRVKAILETAHDWYNKTNIQLVSKALAKAGVFCLKTSTGKGDIETPAGYLSHIDLFAKIKHAVWMYEASHLPVKIAGGVRTKQDLMDIFQRMPADATVFIGTSVDPWMLADILD